MRLTVRWLTGQIGDSRGLDRVFQVFSGVTVIFRNLTIRNGVARDGGTAGVLPDVEAGFGGGILNLGTTTLDHVIVENNVLRWAVRATAEYSSPRKGLHQQAAG